MAGEERREFQRLNLTRPADGWLGDYAIRLLDVSATGALIECDDDIEVGSRALLKFWWRGEEVEITSDVVRNADGQTGLRFTEDSPELRRLITDLTAGSARFAELWDSDAPPPLADPSRRKTVNHPAAGPITLDCDILSVRGSDLRLIVYTAPPGSPDAEALAQLAAPASV